MFWIKDREAKMRKISFVILLMILSISLLSTACEGTIQAEKKEIRIGATAGPYSDQIRKGIQPILEKKGYKVELIEFNDYIQPNVALVSGSIDANVFQNTTYLENYIKENHVDLTGVIPIPTVPMGLYSKKHQREGSFL